VPFVHCRLRPTEDWHPFGIERAQLAVDVGGLHLQGPKGVDRAAIPVRPVQASTRQELRIAAFNSGVHTVTVELDFVQPTAACWRLVN